MQTGGCLCGDIHYEIQGDLPDARVCHCSICRKIFGGTGSYVSWVDSDNFTWRKGGDHLKIFTSQQGFSLGFCGRCGATLSGLYDGQVVCVTLGSMNGNPDIKVGEHIFVGSKAPWDEISDTAPQFDEWPPSVERKIPLPD